MGRDANDANITCFYPSRLLGQPAEGVENYYLALVQPRQVRAVLRVVF